MAQTIYRANLRSAYMPTRFSAAGRTVIQGAQDQHAVSSSRFIGEEADLNLGIPQILYMNNAIPTREGVVAVGRGRYHQQILPVSNTTQANIGTLYLKQHVKEVVPGIYVTASIEKVGGSPAPNKVNLHIFKGMENAQGGVNGQTFLNIAQHVTTDVDDNLNRENLYLTSYAVIGSVVYFAVAIPRDGLVNVQDLKIFALDVLDPQNTTYYSAKEVKIEDTLINPTEVTFTVRNNFRGITAGANRLIVWSGTSIWVSPPVSGYYADVPAEINFNTSSLTGAGQQIVADIRGYICQALTVEGGFILYTFSGAVMAQETADTTSPFIFTTLEGVGPAISQTGELLSTAIISDIMTGIAIYPTVFVEPVKDFTTGLHLVMDVSGLKYVGFNVVKQVSPVIDKMLTSRVDFQQALNNESIQNFRTDTVTPWESEEQTHPTYQAPQTSFFRQEDGNTTTEHNEKRQYEKLFALSGRYIGIGITYGDQQFWYEGGGTYTVSNIVYLWDTKLQRMGVISLSEYPSTAIFGEPNRSTFNPIYLLQEKHGKFFAWFADVNMGGTLYSVAGSALSRRELTTGFGSVQTAAELNTEVDYTQAVIILGKYQLTRNKGCTLQRLEIDGHLYPELANNKIGDFDLVQPNLALKVGISAAIDGSNMLAEVAPTLTSAIGSYRNYRTRLSGKNHTIIIRGAFDLNSLLLTFTSGGRR